MNTAPAYTPTPHTPTPHTKFSTFPHNGSLGPLGTQFLYSPISETPLGQPKQTTQIFGSLETTNWGEVPHRQKLVVVGIHRPTPVGWYINNPHRAKISSNAEFCYYKAENKIPSLSLTTPEDNIKPSLYRL